MNIQKLAALLAAWIALILLMATVAVMVYYWVSVPELNSATLPLVVFMESLIAVGGLAIVAGLIAGFFDLLEPDERS